MNFLERNDAVSNLVGYVLTLSLTGFVVAASTLAVVTVIDEKTVSAAELYAQDLANRVASLITNICLIKEQYPNANYSTTFEIPLKLIDKYSYYVEISNQAVYVNSTDGVIKVSSTNYNVPQRLIMDVYGRVYSSEGKLVVFCKKTDYVYKFDFGGENSLGTLGYTRISDNCEPNNWHPQLLQYRYRTPIYISNPTGSDIDDGYQILIQLTDKNFDYSLVNNNASDLRFVSDNAGGQLLPYWIERWYPSETHVSRIWVNVTDIPATGCTIYMYYSNPLALPYSNGFDTFIFFDDFSQGSAPDSGRWSTYIPSGGELYVKDKMLVLTNKSALKSKLMLYPESSPCIIEVKTKAVEVTENKREASMFVRSKNILGINKLPYQEGLVFSSSSIATGSPGDNLENYLTIIKYQNNEWKNISSNYGKNPVNTEWNRLKYILNGTDNVICRYFYESFSVDGSNATIYNLLNEGYFGLCTTNSGTIAYYDWIFVRKFAMVTSIGSGGRADAEPVAYINGTHSLDYTWDSGLVNSKDLGEGLGRTFVCNATGSGPAFFKIMNLTEGFYSIVFTVGDEDIIVNDMNITLNGGDGNIILSGITCSSDEPYKQILKSNVSVTAAGVLEIKFDSDSVSDYYWTIGGLTLEKGERSIVVRGEYI
jgi:hypothetical protein